MYNQYLETGKTKWGSRNRNYYGEALVATAGFELQAVVPVY